MHNKGGTGIVYNQINRNVEEIDWDLLLKDLCTKIANFMFFASVDGEGQTKAVATKHREFKSMEILPDKTTIGFNTALVAANIVAGVPATGVPSALSIPTAWTGGNLGTIVKDRILVGNRSNGTPVYFRVMDNPTMNGTNHVIPMRRIVTTLTNGVITGHADHEVDIVLADFSAAAPAGNVMSLLSGWVSKPEGGSDKNPVYRLIDDLWNTVTKFVAHTEITDMKAADDWKPGVTPRQFQMTKEIIEFVRGIERAFLFGVPFKGTYRNTNATIPSPSQPHNITGDLQGTRGILNHETIQRYVTGQTHNSILGVGKNIANFRWSDLVKFCEVQVMMHNIKDSLTGFVNRSMLTYLLELVEREGHKYTLDGHGENDQFGMRIMKLRTPHCDINLRVNMALQERYGQDPVLLITDMDKITTRYLANHGENFSMKVEYGVQNPNDDFYLDKVSAIMGVQVDNPTCHSFLHLMQGVA